jgi:hypothetical protein
MTSPKQADELLKRINSVANRTESLSAEDIRSELLDIAHDLRSHLQPPGEHEGREIIDAMIDDLALRARLKSSRTGLQADAALDISDGILERAQEYLAAPSSGDVMVPKAVLDDVNRRYIIEGLGPDYKTVALSCVSCRRIYPNHASDCSTLHVPQGYFISYVTPSAAPHVAQGEADGCREALENLVTFMLETSIPIGPMRSREDYPHELRVAIGALRSAELTLEETQRLLGAESPIPVNVPTDPIALAAAASQLHGQLRHPAPQVDADVQVHHSDIADLNPVLELRSPVVEALTELVALKDLKDANTVDGMWLLDSPHIEYDRRKPLAWEKAREALAEFVPKPTAPDGGGL